MMATGTEAGTATDTRPDTEQGTEVDQADHGVNIGSKPASVLLAIPPTEETTYASAVVASSFVLALSTD